MPLISVLTAVYNAEKYLQATIDSVRAQTIGDWEHILVDDASTDGTPAILERAAAEDARVRVVRLAKNRNPAGAMQEAIRHATGRYAAVLDADDLSLPERFERQSSWLESHPEIVLLGSLNQSIDENGAVRSTEPKQRRRELLPWTVYSAMPFAHSTAMMRMDVLRRVGGYDRAYRTMSDYDLVLRMDEAGHIDLLPEVLACYRKYGEQLSQANHRMQQMQMVLRIQALFAHRFGVKMNSPAVHAWYMGARRLQLKPEYVEPYLTVQQELLAGHVRWRPADAASEALFRCSCAESNMAQWKWQQGEDAVQRRLLESVKELQIDFDCDAWIAAHTDGADGTAA